MKMKTFLWKDRTGRGFKELISAAAILKAKVNEEEELSWTDEPLSEFVENAEIGDTWENRTDEYTCINEVKTKIVRLTIELSVSEDLTENLIEDEIKSVITNDYATTGGYKIEAFSIETLEPLI